jgi:hypothetical protein
MSSEFLLVIPLDLLYNLLLDLDPVFHVTGRQSQLHVLLPRDGHNLVGVN